MNYFFLRIQIENNKEKKIFFFWGGGWGLEQVNFFTMNPN